MATSVLRHYDGEFLECRRGNLGHAWRVVGYYKGEAGETWRNLECQRCESTAVDRWDSKTGERHPRRYGYVEGYVIGDGEQVHGEDVRKEVIRRARVFASEQQMLEALTEGNGKRFRRGER